MDEVRLIEIAEDIHADNELVAQELRSRLGDEKVFLVNLMSAPGSGKTRTILRTVAELQTDLRCGVIEADIDSKVDAEAVAAEGISAVQLNTGGFCHLDATMVAQGLDQLELADLDVVIIENVGNLVCPAIYDLGQALNVVALSTTEGPDKPLKYPVMFRAADLVLLTKADLLPHTNFDVARITADMHRLAPAAAVFQVAALRGDGIPAMAEWLAEKCGC